MSEKTDIEWAAGEAFISLYNAERATTYLAQPSEAPDFHSVDQIQERDILLFSATSGIMTII